MEQSSFRLCRKLTNSWTLCRQTGARAVLAVPSPWFAVARVGWTANESRSRSPKPEKMIRTLPTSECRKYSPTGVATWQDAGCELHDWDCLRLWAAGTCAGPANLYAFFLSHSPLPLFPLLFVGAPIYAWAVGPLLLFIVRVTRAAPRSFSFVFFLFPSSPSPLLPLSPSPPLLFLHP